MVFQRSGKKVAGGLDGGLGLEMELTPSIISARLRLDTGFDEEGRGKGELAAKCVTIEDDRRELNNSKFKYRPLNKEISQFV